MLPEHRSNLSGPHLRPPPQDFRFWDVFQLKLMTFSYSKYVLQTCGNRGASGELLGRLGPPAWIVTSEKPTLLAEESLLFSWLRHLNHASCLEPWHFYFSDMATKLCQKHRLSPSKVKKESIKTKLRYQQNHRPNLTPYANQVHSVKAQNKTKTDFFHVHLAWLDMALKVACLPSILWSDADWKRVFPSICAQNGWLEITRLSETRSSLTSIQKTFPITSNTRITRTCV